MRTQSLLGTALATLWLATPLHSQTSSLLHLLPGDVAVAPAAGDQNGPAIAQGGNLLLAVWGDSRANVTGGYEGETSRDIHGLRLDANGIPLDPVPIAICTAPATQENPKVAWNGANWLVVFDSTVLGGTGYYYDKGLQAVRVSPSGQVLDPAPINLYGLRSSGGYYWSLASDGDNWVVVNQGNSTGGDIVAVRISRDGVVLDPPTRALVKATYYMRSNLKLAYAGGVFLLTYDEMGTGHSETSAVRFDSNLALLTTAFPLNPSPLSDLQANATGFYAVWNRQNPDFSIVVAGSRINTAGQMLDGSGVSISGTKAPYAYDTTAVAWDGLNWRVTWGDHTSVWVARVNTAGQVLDPGSVKVPGPETGRTAGTGNGGLQLVWTVFTNNTYDVYSAPITPSSAAGPNRVLSLGAPQQLRADIATSGNGYMLVYRSATSTQGRVLAQPLDAAGNPVTAEPVELDSGLNVNGPGSPDVAWNGSVYLVAWAGSGGVVAQRLLPSGAKVDPAPFLVMASCLGPADVAALGDDFLVSGRQVGINIQYIFPVVARVSGAGMVLDATPQVLGNSFLRFPPQVVALGGRWLVAWHRNATHDDPYAITMGAFISPDGTKTPEFTLHGPFSTAGGNSIFQVGLGSSGDAALLVQSQELTSGVENDLLCRVIQPDGTVGPMVNLTPWSGNQYKPRVAWDGNSFVIVFQDQRNRLAPQTLDQLDARSDLFGMRVSGTGAVLDPQGFLISASPLGETDPTIAAANGISMLAASLMLNDSTFANYRIAYGLLDNNANLQPVAVATATPSSGDVPLAVSFSSAGSGDWDGGITAYLWDFGDGTASTAANASHTYTAAWPYLATLTVTDNSGAKSAQAVLVNATPPNLLPVAVATADKTSGNAPLPVVFAADGSYDPDGFLGNLQWQFSDGGTYWGSTAYHTFTTIGTHTVTLRVYDSRGGIGTATLPITINDLNQAPVARASGTPSSGSAPLAVQFSSAGSSDPDGTIAAYRWNFGDAFGYSSSEPNPTYQYGYSGTYTATLTVWDNNSVSSSDTVVITVSPDPATLLRSTAIDLSAKLAGSKVTVSGQVTVNDGNGARISGATVTARWTRPDGTTLVQSATTSATGVASFKTSARRGTYTLTVTDIYKYLYTFDAAGSVLSRSITK